MRTFLLVLLLFTGGLLRVSAQEEVTPAKVQSWKQNILWVDARSGKEFRSGHIPGALLLNEDKWESLIGAFFDAWSPECRVVVYCNQESCDASRAIASRLKSEADLQNVYVLKGGWQAWLLSQKKRP